MLFKASVSVGFLWYHSSGRSGKVSPYVMARWRLKFRFHTCPSLKPKVEVGLLSLLGRGGSSSSFVVSTGTTIVAASLILGNCENLNFPLSLLWHHLVRRGRNALLLPAGNESFGSLLSLLWHHLGEDVGIPFYSLVRVEIPASHVALARLSESVARPVFPVVWPRQH